MIFDQTIFYSTYLDDYHKFKIITLKTLLDNADRYEEDFFERGLTTDEKESYKKTLQADLRQTYFHAIETFFELFFHLNPTAKEFIGDENIMIALTRSNWRESYKKIKEIAETEDALNYLDVEVNMEHLRVTIGHYLFYYGLSSKQKMDEKFEEKLTESLSAIKHGIRLIAKDFIDREEYNSYKHGLRIIPALKEISFAYVKTMTPQIKWNLEDSMSFFVKSNTDNEVKIVTKILDPQRDYQMAYFCSNLISQMVYYRKIAFDKQKDPKDLIAIQFFGKDEISKCDKVNVEIQNIIYTIKRITK